LRATTDPVFPVAPRMTYIDPPSNQLFDAGLSVNDAS
jgi:hypothetical protein